MSEAKKEWKPANVSDIDMAFGGNMADLLPPWSAIPEEFRRSRGPWNDWQSAWFFRGLTRYPVPREGIDLHKAMRHLGAIQGSFEPKHEHKQAGIAYLASLWFSSPDGEQIKAAA